MSREADPVLDRLVRAELEARRRVDEYREAVARAADDRAVAMQALVDYLGSQAGAARAVGLTNRAVTKVLQRLPPGSAR